MDNDCTSNLFKLIPAIGTSLLVGIGLYVA